MQDKKVIAFVVLAVLAVISLVYGVTANPKNKYKSAAAVQAQAALTPAQSAAATGGVISAGRHAKRSQFKEWKRNPFISGQTASVASGQALVLNGIIWNKVKPKAMIGDAIVVKGDTIGANKVVDIQQNKVILNDGTKDFELIIEK